MVTSMRVPRVRRPAEGALRRGSGGDERSADMGGAERGSLFSWTGEADVAKGVGKWFPLHGNKALWGYGGCQGEHSDALGGWWRRQQCKRHLGRLRTGREPKALKEAEGPGGFVWGKGVVPSQASPPGPRKLRRRARAWTGLFRRETTLWIQ